MGESTGGLFGTALNGAASSGSPFGTGATSAGSLFGGASGGDAPSIFSAPIQGSGGSLFGSMGAASSGTSSGASLFGGASGGSLFGGASGGSLFGNASSGGSGGSLFGSSAPSSGSIFT